MRNLTTIAVLVAMAICLEPARAAERNLADGLAAAGAVNLTKGNTALAKDLFYKALAHDDTCPDALFELAKIVDKEGDASTAGDLFQRAALNYAQDNKPTNAAKRAEAEKRAHTLNPAAAKLCVLFEEYATDLDKIVKKLPDALTEASALERVNELQLPAVLPPDKLPKFYSAAQAAQEKKAVAVAKRNDEPGDNMPRKKRRLMEGAKPEGSTAPEVEKELKQLGWSTVHGTWIKKGPGVYEGTDAKLEAQKINGLIDFTVVKGGGDGTVKATVRTDSQNPSDYAVNGYGTFFRGHDFRNFGYGERLGKARMAGVGGVSGPANSLAVLGTFPITESAAKNHFTVKVDDNSLEFSHNNVINSRSSNPKLSHTGTFLIDVTGTVLIEMPRCGGQ